LTYGPAKAAPANRNGDAAAAAIVDLIDIFVLYYLASNKKPADGKSFDIKILTFYAGYDYFGPLLCNVIYYTIVSLGCQMSVIANIHLKHRKPC